MLRYCFNPLSDVIRCEGELRTLNENEVERLRAIACLQGVLLISLSARDNK